MTSMTHGSAKYSISENLSKGLGISAKNLYSVAKFVRK